MRNNLLKYFLLFMPSVLLWQDVTFFFSHMSSEYPNLGIALMGFPSSLALLCGSVHSLFDERKRVSGILLVIAAPVLLIFELVIHFLQEFPIMFNLVIALIFYIGMFIVGCIEVKKASKNEVKS